MNKFYKIEETIKKMKEQWLWKLMKNLLRTTNGKSKNPKIHKTGNHGRPAVSSVNSPTSKMSGFVEFQLQANIT